jgi:DNA-binding XRE family transcriptional regulator
MPDKPLVWLGGKVPTMNQSKRRRLEAKGWKFGSAKDFLKLTDEDVEYVELHLSLAALLTKRRGSLGYTQTDVADLIGSSQSRVAKMEAGDPSVSVDLLIRTLLALGLNRQQVGRAMGA